jgi:single-stranded DNA-binding protein
MNKVFLFGKISYISLRDSFCTFSMQVRTQGYKEYSYINCIISGIKAKRFADTFRNGDYIMIEGRLRTSEKDKKFYVNIIVENFYSSNKAIKFIDIDEKENKDKDDYPF